MRKPSHAHRLLTLAALLAALPAAAAPNNITDLGPLKSDNSGSSGASAISANGRTVVGNSDRRAVVWSGSGWGTKTALGTLRADNSGWASASAVSDDGSVVVGSAEGDNVDGRSNAVVWSGSGWSTKTNLNLAHNSDIRRSSAAYGVSGDGSVVVGEAYVNDTDDMHAVVWSGSNWASQTDLGTLTTDNSKYSSRNSRALAANHDGSVVVGYSRNDIDEQRAIVWSGRNWGTKTDLGTLKADNSGSSTAVAINRDGSMVVGWADDDNGRYATVWSGSGWGTKTKLDTPEDFSSSASSVSADGSVIGGSILSRDGFYRHAVVWSGSNWGTKTELGTLKSDNSGSSEVNGLSADGNFAVGYVENDDYVTRAVVWNLRSLNIRPTDTANTRTSLSLLSADTASLLAQRARAAENLLGGCRADGGKFCYSAGYRRDIGHGASSRGADFAFGYGFTDNFDAAVSLAVPARAEENGSHRLKSGVGIGLSARLHNGAGWYAVPAAAFETDKTRIRRPHLDGTESPENTVRTKSRAYSLTAGRDYGTPGEKTLGWYAALRRTEAERPSYSEDAGLSFPFPTARPS